MRSWNVGAVALAIALFGCDGDGTTPVEPEPPSGPRDVVQADDRRYGEPSNMGSGGVQAWLQEDGAGTVVAVGVTFTEEALGGLAPDHEHWSLDLPEAAGILFDHVLLGWNPEGHPPPGIYTVPHFDFHFVMMTRAEREAIPGGEPDPVEARFLPAGFVPDPIQIPGEGQHWVDPTGPEFNGQPFTHTLVYGFAAGRMAFVEPMVTREFLEGRADVAAAIPQPEAHQRAGLYPTEYAVEYDAENGQYDVLLKGLVAREASE